MTAIGGTGALDAAGILDCVNGFEDRAPIEIDLTRTAFVTPAGLVFLGIVMAQAQSEEVECVMRINPHSVVARYCERVGLLQQAARCNVNRTRVATVTRRDPEDRFVELTRFDVTGDTVATDLDRVLLSQIREWQVDHQRLAMAVNELASNVESHAGEAGLVSAQRYSDRVEFAVGDHGRGVKRSLEQAGHTFTSDLGALKAAVTTGVSSTGDSFRGKGLPGLIAKVAHVDGGWCAFQSGWHRLEYRAGHDPVAWRLGYRSPGTLVCGGFATTRSPQ